MKRAGFTGTRAGMSSQQMFTFASLLRTYKPEEFHHGDCVGSDLGAHMLVGLAVDAGDLITRVVVHPPEIEASRAFCRGDEVREPKSYLDRNHDIVDETGWLIATPLVMRELSAGGTWRTIQYAREKWKPIVIIWPDGTVKWENMAHNCRFEYCDAPLGLCSTPE